MTMFEIIKQVFSSWQVIVVTLIILLYIHLVTHVSKRYRRPRVKMKKIKLFNKKAVQSNTVNETLEELPGSDSNDELGLEEA
ncbi:MAG: hypothetical protein FWD28_05795 [Treponema sp.]|nr:hypothetical protein [Treponema sp.]